MIGTNQYELTWSHFEQLHADKKMAFENLSRSLFLRELCPEGTILHSDHNHPGVEVIPVLAENGKTKISFQAKHFDNVIGYAQIKKSVNEAVTHYTGKLDVIYLYCNKDITESCNSYKEIIKKLSAAGIRMELVTGQTILDQAMNYPQILSCYFGLDSLDDEWFKKNIELSLANLGRRYNPLFNVDTEAQRNISLFLRETTGIAEVNAKKDNLIKELKELSWSCDSKYKMEINKLMKRAKSIGDVDLKSFTSALGWKDQFENECSEVFFNLRNRLEEVQAGMTEYSYEDSEYKKLREEEFCLESILGVESCLEFSRTEKNIISCRVAIITGEMGTGKSQLLATASKRMADSGRPVLLLLGQTFISDESIETQIMNNLEGLSLGQSFESLVSVMDEKSGLIGEDAIIFIDAINESKNRDAWKNGINRIITTLDQYSNVKLVVSLRTGFEELTLSQSVLDKIDSGEIAMIRHTGLIDESPARIYEFLSYCGIPFSPEYYLHSEMTNPLFLTWFCSTYNGEEQGLLTLIDNVLKQADQEGSRGAGLSETVGLLRPLIYEMLDVSVNGRITKQELLGLSAWSTYGVGNKIGYLNAIERAGVLTSFVREQEEKYYIGYNLLEDYLKAERIVEREQSKENIIEYCEKTLFDIDAEGSINNYGNESIFAMIASLYAMKHGDELVELIDKVNDVWDRDRLINDYYSSFIWRSSHISYDDFLKLINNYPIDYRRVWDVFIENSVKEKSGLNALGLTKFLNRYQMNQRDFLWTTVINDYDENNRMISLAHYIEAGNVLDGMSENKAYLLTITYAWMLSSSNRNLRDRVSKAMIEILKEHFSVCVQLLTLFKDVNDPYILQRLYGVVFGAVMKRRSENLSLFKVLAQWVYKEIFDKEMVYPDILLRDYARLIIERFAIEYPNYLDDIQLSRVKPPYKSETIPIVEEIDYGADEYRDSGLWPLLFSMKFDLKVKGVGMYGDFGRYVFQSALNDFVDLNVVNVYYYAIQYILNDLGYNPEWFAEYDQYRSGYDRHYVKRVERIGKKYQWITMYNILARVSDSYNVKSWNWGNQSGTSYEGPWEPYVRDFDPTLNTKIHLKDAAPQILLPTYGEESFCDINSSTDDIEKWILEEDKMFQDFPERFINKDKDGKEWISLYLYQENELRPEGEEYSALGFPKGEQHVWTIAVMYILPKTKNKYSEQYLLESDFIKRSSSELKSCYSLFSREYAWSPGYEAEFKRIDNEEGETGLNAFPATVNFLWEEGYDASQENATSFAIPAGNIIQEMQLYEKTIDGIFYRNEEVVAFDLSVVGNKQTELVIRKDVFDEYITKIGAQAFWTVIGEKQFFMGGTNQKWQKREGYFVYGQKKIAGSMRRANNR